MPRYKLVVMSSATEGREDEYNTWYNNQHLGDVVNVPGFSSAYRMKLNKPVQGEFRHKYCAIYDLDATDPNAAVQALMTTQMHISEAINSGTVDCAVFEVCSPQVAAPEKKAAATA